MKPAALAFAAAVAASLLPLAPLGAEPPAAAARAGERYEIRLTRDSVEQSNGEHAGSSHDQDTMVERVVAVHADGIELEYDLADRTSAEERAKVWQFPARVLKPARGPMQLLNVAELERRVDAWLKRAKWPRAVCGHWIFTWNAFRIDCDPPSVLGTIAAFDLDIPDVREGAPYIEPGALAAAPLVRAGGDAAGATFTARLALDPDFIRRRRAEQDVVVGEIMRKPRTLEEAMRERAKETVSGTMTVTLETDGAGTVLRKISVTKVETRLPDGTAETHQSTAVLERHRIAPTPGRDAARR